MGYTNDLVLIATEETDADRFPAIVREHTVCCVGEIAPVESVGGCKPPNADVFHLGLNGFIEDLWAALEAEKWRGHVTIWFKPESGGARVLTRGYVETDA